MEFGGNTIKDDKTRRIEEVACALKFGKLSEYKKKNKGIELVNLLIEVCFKRISIAMNNETENMSFIDDDIKCNYDGEVFVEAYNYALNRYGELDKDTGERILFIRLFRKAYNVKGAGIKSSKFERVSDEGTLRKSAVRKFLEKVRFQKNISVTIPRLDYINKNKCIEILKIWGVYSEYIDELDEIFSNKHIVCDVQMNNDNGDVFSCSDSREYEKHCNHDVEANKLCLVFSKFLDLCAQKGHEQLGRTFLTLLFLEKGDTDKISEYQDYLDKEFYEYCSKYPINFLLKNKNEIAGEFFHYKPDTMRKKLAAVSKEILKINILI